LLLLHALTQNSLSDRVDMFTVLLCDLCGGQVSPSHRAEEQADGDSEDDKRKDVHVDLRGKSKLQ
jgi:hypothetical protein